MMNRKRTIKRICLTVLSAALLLGSLLRRDALMTARAASEDGFIIDAEVLPSDAGAYSIRLTVGNSGDDWEGAVRLVVDEDYRVPCAYDTWLSLPQGSRKQFVVKVPVDSVESTNGTVVVSLVDKKEEKAAEKEFKRLLTGPMDSLGMGILSDAYQKLTYLDMGGDEIFFYNDRYPVRLVELQQGSLVDVLDSLTILVIDHYNTSILTEEELEAIRLWNLDGGVLILGTGTYAEDVLSGFDDGYLLGILYMGTYAPGDAPDEIDSAYVDLSPLTLAGISGIGGTYNDYYTGGRSESLGNGSVSVMPYSLAELGDLSKSYWNVDPEFLVAQLLESACDNAGSRYSTSQSYYDSLNSYVRRLLGVMGNSNSILNFGVLKWLVVLYVIFVGPVLYLILRSLKRRELYWAAVPVSAVLGVIMISFAGRGFEVVSTKAYSVTVVNLNGNGKNVTYLHCYDAKRDEWRLRLAEGCEYVGPLGSTYRYSGVDTDSYYYHIMKEGDVFSVGMKPDTNFEDSYFCLTGTGNNSGAEGSLLMQNMGIDISGVRGTVVNDTNKDIEYFAVIWHDFLYVYENLPIGASCDLADEEPIYRMSGSYYGSYIYDFLNGLSAIYDGGEYGTVSTLSALGVGIFDVYPLSERNDFVVIGVVKNWDKAVDDNCSEISYGCLYAVQM